MTENELKKHVLSLAYKNGWRVHHAVQGYVSYQSGSDGYPDLTCARDRELVFIELKQEKAALSPAQYQWQEALPAMHVIRPSDWESGRVAELLA